MKKNKGSVNCRPAFNSHIRFIAMGVVLAVLVLSLSIYNYYSLRSKTEIRAGDTLSGQRIACCVGWESDFLLTPRKDITLLRYDSNADSILALSFGQVDAVAIDEITMTTVFARTDGLEQLPDPITTVGCTMYASRYAEDKLSEFNLFVAEFLKSDEYQPFHDKVLSEDYRMTEIPEVSGGKTLRVGYMPDGYPGSYIDFTTGKPAGYAVEMLQRFAYAKGYTLEWTEASENSALIQLSMGQLDFAACYTSDVYRNDTEMGGMAHMTDAFMNVEVYLVKIKDGEKLVITGEIDT